MTTSLKETQTDTQNLPAVIDWNPSAVDRCDRCPSSRAYTRATKGTGQLYLCGHHTHKFQAALISEGWDLDIHLDILEKECAAYKAVPVDNF